jgi:hypothetical protein
MRIRRQRSEHWACSQLSEQPSLWSQEHLSQLLYSYSEITLPPLHPEVYHRSPTAPSKAIPVVARLAYPQARVVVIVEGTQSRLTATPTAIATPTTRQSGHFASSHAPACAGWRAGVEFISHYALPIHPQGAITGADRRRSQSTLPELRAAMRTGRRTGGLVPHAGEPRRHALCPHIRRGLLPFL